jgi:hypothetical protein
MLFKFVSREDPTAQKNKRHSRRKTQQKGFEKKWLAVLGNKLSFKSWLNTQRDTRRFETLEEDFVDSAMTLVRFKTSCTYICMRITW